MSDFNLEVEYGQFLDALDQRLSEIADGETVQHYGVKGMKWGVRKERSSSEPLRSLGPDQVQRKTASGETITLTKKPPTAFHNFIGRVSPKYRESYKNHAYLVIKDGSGKRIGDAQVSKKSADELNLVWLGINKSARGRGYATAVMKAGADFGRQEGFKKLTLEVPGNSPDARHIYEKLGFKVTKDAESDDDAWGGLTEMEYDFDREASHGLTYTAEHLVHYGVKGMKWGVIRDRTTSTAKRFAAKIDKKKAKKAAVIFGAAVGTAAIAAGGVYAAKQLGGSAGLTKMRDIPIKESAKKFAESMAEEPVGIVHASRGRNKGFTFPARGGLTDPVNEYAKAGFDGISGGDSFRRYGDRLEKVAARFIDPEGRKDFAGRPIHHEVMLPEDLAKGINNLDDVTEVAWPLIKDKFDAMYDS